MKVYALNLFNVADKEEYLAYSRRSAREVQAHGGTVIALGRFRDLVVDLDPFVFNGEVEGFLTRLSGTSLANVTSGGGQVPAFLIQPVS